MSGLHRLIRPLPQLSCVHKNWLGTYLLPYLFIRFFHSLPQQRTLSVITIRDQQPTNSYIQSKSPHNEQRSYIYTNK